MSNNQLPAEVQKQLPTFWDVAKAFKWAAEYGNEIGEQLVLTEDGQWLLLKEEGGVTETDELTPGNVAELFCLQNGFAKEDELKAQSAVWVKASDRLPAYESQTVFRQHGNYWVGVLLDGSGDIKGNVLHLRGVLHHVIGDDKIKHFEWLDESGATDWKAKYEKTWALLEKQLTVEQELLKAADHSIKEYAALKDQADRYGKALRRIAEQRTCSEQEADEDITIGSDGTRLGDIEMGYDCCISEAREALAWKGEEYPKLTPDQISERKAAIEWYRNPSGEKEGDNG